MQINAEDGDRPMHSVVGGTNNTESLFVCRTGGANDLARPGQLDWKGCCVVTGETSKVFLQYQVRPIDYKT